MVIPIIAGGTAGYLFARKDLEQTRLDQVERIADLNSIKTVDYFHELASDAVIAGLAAAYRFSKSMTEPIRSLQKGTEIIGRVRLDHKFRRDLG